MINPFNISDDKLIELLNGYDAWLNSNPIDAAYPEETKEKSRLIRAEFLNKDALQVLSEDDLYERIFNYSRSLEGPVHMRLGEQRLRDSLPDIRRNLIYIMTSDDTPFTIAQNILEGEFRIEVFAKAFWSPILLAWFPDKLPNWNNKTERFLKKFNIRLSSSKLTISERYKILSDTFTYLARLKEGHDFYTINHLMHYGTVINEGANLINQILGKNHDNKIVELVEHFKEKIRNDGLKDELYKWELIKKYKGRPDITAEDFYSEIKSINYSNLIYHTAVKVKNHIASKHPDEYKDCFIRLFDDNEDLSFRVNSFINEVLTIYRKIEPNLGSHHDERTTSVFLAYYDPESYALYKDSFYQKYCNLIGVKPKQRGEKYGHYMELICEFRDNYITPDEELIFLINNQLSPDCYVDESHLILAQNILYQMLDQGSETIDEMDLVRKLKAFESRSYIEAFFELLEQVTSRFDLSNEDLRLSFSVIRDNNRLSATINQRYVVSADLDKGTHDGELNIVWLLIPASYEEQLKDHRCFLRKSAEDVFKKFIGEAQAPLWVALNIFSLLDDANLMETWLSGIETELLRGTKSGFRQYHNSAYFNAITDPEYRTIILDRVFGAKQMLKKMNLNTILFGPPGTGKTYRSIDLAVQIASPDDYIFNDHKANKTVFERLLHSGQVSFTTFHQSMSYEDFIEGIKPSGDESSGLTYTVVDGLFKKMSVQAAFEFVRDKQSSASKSLSFSSAYDKLIDEATEKIGKDVGYTLKLKSGVELEIIEITTGGNLLVQHQNGSRTYTVSRRRLEKLFSELPDLESISNINEAIRKVIGGSNASAYWAILKRLRSITVDVKEAINSKMYSYEDKAAAIEKLQPDEVKINEGVKNYVIIIDEINRGNVSQIFGELITLIEEDKRYGKEERLSATLPYSRSRFFVPPNLYILGTMNTADRSVEALDTALRRRFSFIEMKPIYNLEGMDIIFAGFQLAEILETLNTRIEKLIDRDHRIGHSYFLGLKKTEDLMNVFRNKVIPLLQEYFYSNYEKMGLVLGSGFINKLPDDKVTFAPFSADVNDYNNKVIFRIEEEPLQNVSEFEKAVSTLMTR